MTLALEKAWQLTNSTHEICEPLLQHLVILSILKDVVVVVVEGD